MRYRELLIGCGSRRDKYLTNTGQGWHGLTTLDFNADHNPDVVCDLEQVGLPFKDNTFHEIHAYHVLEHTGQQGDWQFFFDQFHEFHRIMVNGGLFVGICPLYSDRWAWSDPGHKRVIHGSTLGFLCQEEYQKQVGVTAFTDYRFYYKADFRIWSYLEEEGQIHFILQAKKGAS